MKVHSQRGIAILAVLIFAAVALPLVIILMNLLASHRAFGTSQYSREIMDNYSSDGINDAVNLLSTSRPYLVSCDSNGRVNDQVEWVNPSTTFDYLAAYWIRWPFVHSARTYESNIPSGVTDPDLSATSLIAYPWFVYRDDTTTDGPADCVPDPSTLAVSGSAFVPDQSLRLIVAFAPYGRRNVLFPKVSGSPGYPGDLIWTSPPTAPLVTITGTTPLNDSLFSSIRNWLADPSFLPFEPAFAGQRTGPANDRFNAYQRTNIFDPLLPAEGYALPAGNLGLLDNDAGRLLTPALGGRTTFDPTTDSIPSGYEVSISDEGARLPLYDWFHNPDDALFHNPLDYGNPPEPFSLILGPTDFPQTNLLADGWAQQVRSLGFLVRGFGTSLTQFIPARALISHIAYYDIGDQGRRVSGTVSDYPNGARDDYDGNGFVDEPMTRFPSSLKQLMDANRILPESPANGNSYNGVGSDEFNYLKANATAVFAPNGAYQTIEDPLIRRAYALANSFISTKYPLWRPWDGWPNVLVSGCGSSLESEPNNSSATADPVTLTCLHTGSVRLVSSNCSNPSSDCDDWWSFSPVNFRPTTIILRNPSPTANAVISLSLYDGSTLLDTLGPLSGGENASLSRLLAPGSTYYVRISASTTSNFGGLRPYQFVALQTRGSVFCTMTRLQDCLIDVTAPLSVAEYNSFNSLNNGWRDPASLYPFWLRTILNNDWDNDGVGDVQEHYNSLFAYFLPLTDATVADLLARRHIGHWGAWQYFYRYIVSTNVCFGIGPERVDEHARYHGIGDTLIPVPTAGPWYDPGNVLLNGSCAGSGGNLANWPPLWVPVDRDGNGVFDPANPANPYFCVNLPRVRDCMLRLFPSGIGVDAVYEIPDRMPSPITYNATRQRLSDESLLFQLAAGVLEGSNPYLTYFDSNARSQDSDGKVITPNPVNEICDPQGLRADPGSGVTSSVGNLPKGEYYVADGRSSGSIYTDPSTGQLVSMASLCAYSPNTWPDQVPDLDRPLRYRLRININTATVPVLTALSAKFSNRNQNVSATRSSRFAQSITLYREWFYRTPNLAMNRTNHGVLAGWLNSSNPFSGGILNLNSIRNNTSSILTSYFLNVLSNPSLVNTPLLSPFDWNNTNAIIYGKFAFPNDRLNPPFRNIGQLFDVRYVTSRAADPRDIDETTGSCRVLAILQTTCSTNGRPAAGQASEAARFFARIDQDIAVKSYAYRLESFGRLGNHLRQKAVILSPSSFFPSGEIEWQQQDLTPIATKYY